MALKDWKKIGKDEWENKKKNELLMLYTGFAYLGKYWLRLFKRNHRIGIENPKDLTGAFEYDIALQKAKSYMRNH